jgi:hypothetical protein
MPERSEEDFGWQSVFWERVGTMHSLALSKVSEAYVLFTTKKQRNLGLWLFLDVEWKKRKYLDGMRMPLGS